MLSTIEFHAIFTMYRLPRALQCRFFSKKAFELSSEVESALREKRPVVALESTIITHGMPHPSNLTTAIAVQDIIRAQNAIPALVAVMNGTIKVGLSNKQIEELADPKSKAVKTSRRDFPYVISNKLNGGTTVSGTLFVCSSVGIDIFVTGGIGGVHRDGEVSLDISADLVELGRHSIMVVSSGVKSILDIERTLEYLETEGVCVVTYGSSKNFPAFYSEESGQLSPYHVMEPHQAAKLLHSSKQIGLDSGILLAVPVPNQFSIDLKEMNTVINLALDAAEQQGINGKNVTPFVLDKVSQLTKGKSLETNIALIKNNAHIGAKVAVEYTKLNKMSPPGVPPVIQKDNKRPVVIGGSVLDCALTICDELQLDGRTIPGRITQNPGGVGRNIADCLGKISDEGLLFISAVGKDQFGQFLLESIRHIDHRGVQSVEDERTACYSVLIDGKGEAKFAVGDMNINSKITKDVVSNYVNEFRESSIVIMDGNIPQETLNYVIEQGSEHNVSVWFEPTSVLKSAKPFETPLWKSLACISPNMTELKEMANAVGVKFDEDFDQTDVNNLLKQIVYLTSPLAEHIPLIMVTLGKFGILMVTKYNSDAPVKSVFLESSNKETMVRYYPTIPLDDVVNSLGAGDSAAASFAEGMLRGLTEPECITLSHLASAEALRSPTAIPTQFKHDRQSASRAQFLEISFSTRR